MTEAELKAYEAEANGVCSSCMTLVVEVRRLKALVKRAEHQGYDGSCPWCAADVCLTTLPIAPHGHDCPVFTEDGSVR